MLSEKQLNHRFALLKNWLARIEPYQDIIQIAGDASFRRYFRVSYKDKTLIAMDAPPKLEDSHAFVDISKLYEAKGLTVPHVIHVDLSLGFMLITDLADDLYLRVLTADNADKLYALAIDKLHIIQSIPQDNPYHFPPFSRDLLMEELKNFQYWYLETHLAISLNVKQTKLLVDTFELLVSSALEQPQVCIHRDYHSRNLMLLPNNDLGILDFQDALWGPLTYDLVSLIRDCYIDWPQEKVAQWMQQYYQQALDRGTFKEVSYQQFKQWFDWMGIQRHLKAIFIFARKWHRDDNKDYLGDIPRALQYIKDIGRQYSQLSDFMGFFLERK
jgi:aminoglycoside/choline kinase family phosphotransferase